MTTKNMHVNIVKHMVMIAVVKICHALTIHFLQVLLLVLSLALLWAFLLFLSHFISFAGVGGEIIHDSFPLFPLVQTRMVYIITAVVSVVKLNRMMIMKHVNICSIIIPTLVVR